MAQDMQAPAYRWVIVAAAALMFALAMGSMVNGMSAYIVPMEEAHGWDRGQISLINVAGIVGLALGGLVLAPIADRRGARSVALFGCTVMAVCYFAASYANALWQYYILMFLAGFFGGAGIFAPIMAMVGNWFPGSMGLALGIASAGQALGQGGVPFLSAYLITRWGIDGAFAITGIAMFVILLPLAWLLRPAPIAGSPGSGAAAAPDESSYPSPKLVIPAMSAAGVLCCTCMSVPLMHLVPLVQDRGIPLEEASSVIFLMLMVGIVGRVSFGKLADIIGALPAYMTAVTWMAVLVYGFTQIGALEYFYLYAAIYGFGYAGVMTGVIVSISSLTHPSRRASALAIVNLFNWFGHAIGGYLGGFLFDQTGSYSPAYAVAAIAGLANLFIVGTLYMKTRGPTLKTAQS